MGHSQLWEEESALPAGGAAGANVLWSKKP